MVNALFSGIVNLGDLRTNRSIGKIGLKAGIRCSCEHIKAFKNWLEVRSADNADLRRSVVNGRFQLAARQLKQLDRVSRSIHSNAL